MEQEGKCPKCNGPLSYPDGYCVDNISSGELTYSVECKVCDWIGTEVNTITFARYES